MCVTGPDTHGKAIAGSADRRPGRRRHFAWSGGNILIQVEGTMSAEALVPSLWRMAEGTSWGGGMLGSW